MLLNCGVAEDSWESLGLQGNQCWIFTGRTEAEAPILWPPDVNNCLTGKDSDVGKDWRQEDTGWQRKRWLDGIPDLMDMSLSKILELVMDRKAWHAVVHRVTKSWTMTEQLNSSKKLTMHIDNGHFYLTSGLWANFPVFYISESMMLIKFNIKCLFSD